MPDYQVEPIPGEDHEGRQYGYMVTRDGEPFLRCTTGGTGPCWNFDFVGVMDGDEAPFHVCQRDLPGLIVGLRALYESDANQEHVARWAT